MKKRDLVESIIEASLIANKSSVWWQQEMNACLREIEQLDKSEFNEDWEKKEEIEEKMEYLIKKGQWEDKNLDMIFKQMADFQESEKRHIVAEITKRWNNNVGQDDTPF